MTQGIVVRTTESDSAAAGVDLANKLQEQLRGAELGALIIFAAPAYQHSALLSSLIELCPCRAVVGCSTAGEFINAEPSSASAVAIGIVSNEIMFSVAVGRGISANHEGAAEELVTALAGRHHPEYGFRSALIFADALAGSTESLVEHMTTLTAGDYQFAGGGAADGANFAKTWVYSGREAFSDAVVALEILSKKPVGIGVSHGWKIATPALRVTDSQDHLVRSLDAAPAGEVFEDFANSIGTRFDRSEPLPFFLHHVIGVTTPAGYKLRVPLHLNADDSVECAADIPSGGLVHLMSTDIQATADSAVRAVQNARKNLHGEKPALALFFDCAATRLRLGDDFQIELSAVADELGALPLAGCNTYGQIARAAGQFSGFHNCTAVVGLFPA